MEEDNNTDIAASGEESAVLNPWPARLKRVVRYAMLVAAPLLSILALVIALVSFNRQPVQSMAPELTARLNNLETELAEAKADLETTKVALARERSLREEGAQMAEGRESKVVQAVSELQTRMKLSPTLQEQWRAASSIVAPAESSPPSAAAAAPTPGIQPQPAQPAPAQAAPNAHVASRSKVPAPVQKPTAPAGVKESEKRSPQVHGLKQTIEQMNKSR